LRHALQGDQGVEPGEDRCRGRDHLEARDRLRHQQIGYVIHGAIHKARPDVACVLHTHTRAGIAVSAMKCGLLPLSQTAVRFVGHIGYHDYEGPAVDLDERERIVSDLGPHDALVMRNHGLLTCGATTQQAFNTMYQLELSCRSQVDAMAARAELVMP